jgi:hypothetical protein
MATFVSAMGRPVSLAERLTWIVRGSGAESTDNLIFEDDTGQISIQVYDFLAEPSFHLPPSVAISQKRGRRCVERSEHVYVRKNFGNSTKVHTLDIMIK